MKKLFAILLLIQLQQSSGQTRLRLTQTTSVVSPAFNAGWDVTTGASRWLMNPNYTNGATVTVTSGATGAAAVRKILFDQWISSALIAQTLNGTLTGQILMNMGSVSSRTGEGWVYFRIWHANNTITEVGTLTTTALTTTRTNRTFIALTLSAVNIVAGDRLVIALGWNYSTGVNTATAGTISVRDGTNTSDLPVDNTTTTVLDPWFEFSQTLKFQNQSNFFF